MRIVSLTPSATEIVCALGLSRQLVGVTHECDFPPEAVGKPVMTRSTLDLRGVSNRTIDRRVQEAIDRGESLYELDVDELRQAKPDLIISQELCTVCAPDQRSVQEVARQISSDIAVISLDPTTIEGIFNTITTVGAMTETEGKALALLARLRGRLGRMEQKVGKARSAGHAPLRVVGLEWLDPPFVVGHWVPEQIRRAGGWDLLGREGEPAVRTTWNDIRDVEPDMLLLMPCGYHLADTVREFGRMRRPAFWDDILAVQRHNVIALDGSAYFSRPGPRVVDGISLLTEIFDPNRFVDVAPPMSWEPIPV